jgi:hypothetical protein
VVALLITLTNVIFKSLMVNWGLTMDNIINKLISFGFDGVVVFIGVHNGVTTQITKKVAPFHACCPLVAHQTDLALQTFSTHNLWCISLKVSCKPYTPIFSFYPRGIWSSASLHSC